MHVRGPDAGEWSRISGGEVAERPNAPVLKTGVVRATAGSNPALSAKWEPPRIETSIRGGLVSSVMINLLAVPKG